MTTYTPRHKRPRPSLWKAAALLLAEMFTPYRRADEVEVATP